MLLRITNVNKNKSKKKELLITVITENYRKTKHKQTIVMFKKIYRTVIK